jgi:uncharacterized protein YycO
MNYIYFASYEGKSLISRLIKWRTWSRKSHTSAFLPDLNTVIEAWDKGVRKLQWNQGHKPGTRIDIYRVQCTEEQAIEFYTLLEQHVGIKYDFLAIAGFALRIKLQRHDRMFCSEMVFDLAKRAGIELLKRIEPYKVSPGKLDTTPLAEFVETRRT